MEITEDVKKLTGNPRRSILTMSVPLMVAMLISYVQNFVDAAWCSGLGSSSLAAITVSGPLYWIIIDIGIGIGVGASTSVARALGAKNYEGANSLAVQSLLLSVIIAGISTVCLMLLGGPVLYFMTDGGDTSLCWQYVLPFFICVIPISMHGTLIGLLRAEGAGKKVLYLSVISSALNLVIDPIFIYVLGWGLAGAATATCLAMIVPLIAGLYWYFSGRTFIKLTVRDIRIKTDEMKDILCVGLPHMLELMAISFLMVPQNMLVMRIGGEVGIVLALTPYKFILLTVMPAQGLAQAMIPVTSALQGAGRPEDAKDGFMYTIRVSTIVCILLSVLLIIAADPLTWVFTYTGDMADLHDKLAWVLRLYGFITLFAGLTEVFSAILQSLRRAMLATFTMIFRETVFIGMYIIAATISMEAIYYCMVLGMLFGVVVMGLFAAYCMRKIPRSVNGVSAS